VRTQRKGGAIEMFEVVTAGVHPLVERSEVTRAACAIRLLNEKVLPYGRWLIGAVHPDYLNAGRLPRYFLKHKKDRKALLTGPVGTPSKMMTLKVLRVLKRLGEALPVRPRVHAD
jgi:hypothetical protein